jgi:hypothetical protein
MEYINHILVKYNKKEPGKSPALFAVYRSSRKKLVPQLLG